MIYENNPSFTSIISQMLTEVLNKYMRRGHVHDQVSKSKIKNIIFFVPFGL